MSPPDYFVVFGGHHRLAAVAVAEPECLLVPLSHAMTRQIQ
jgi:hypothetical protein